MSWQEDYASAVDLGDALGVKEDQLQDWHDESGWTWEQIADRLAIQDEFASYYRNDEMPPDWLVDAFYEYEGDDDVPEWFNFYHD